MPSQIPGFEYDIFISYRRKDNKGDKWVSEFVEALKDELESTFKEEITIYFDANPQDGLQEIPDANDSLKEKLNCLIFIPILSRTYCDPKSFAWENEFVAFIEQARHDQFGLKVKLPGGNVASRLLPVRIHDLDSNDIAICEAVTGGVLRGVEFIYKSPGVNRPLRPLEEKPWENINNTLYRDQINKVSLALKDIIAGLQNGSVLNEIVHDQEKELIKEVKKADEKKPEGEPSKMTKYKFLSGAVLLTLLIIAVIIIYPKIINRNTFADPGSSEKRIYVAILPFKNLTNDKNLDVQQEAIQDELINYLTNYSEELRVDPLEKINGLLHEQGITKSNYSSLSPAVVSKISAKLGADVSITGTINQSGSVFRINVQLTDSKTGDVLKPFKKEGIIKDGNMFQIIEPLKEEIRNYLLISRLNDQDYIDPARTGTSESPEAYKALISGQKAFASGDYPEVIKLLSQAVVRDSNLVYATLQIGWAYFCLENFNQAKAWCLKAFRKIDQMPPNLATYTNFVHTRFSGTPDEAIRHLKQLKDIDDQWPHLHYDMGQTYIVLLQYEKAITEFETALEMYRKKDLKPLSPFYYTNLGKAYHATGKYKVEKMLYKKAIKEFPDNRGILQRQAILAFTEGDTTEGEKFTEKYISVGKDDSALEINILTGVAEIYSEAGIMDKAEKYYRQALSLQPDNPEKLFNLAWFQIDNNLDINEGLDLVEKALQLHPNDYLYLDCKGLGLFKQGKFNEALNLFQKADSLKPVYTHRINQHLEEAKKERQ